MIRSYALLLILLVACTSGSVSSSISAARETPTDSPLHPLAQQVYDRVTEMGITPPLCELPYTEEKLERVAQLNTALPELLSDLLPYDSQYSLDELAGFLVDGISRASGQYLRVWFQVNGENRLISMTRGYCRFGSHDYSPIDFYVQNNAGELIKVGEAGQALSIDPMTDGWVILVRLSTLSYGSSPHEVWHVSTTGEKRILMEFQQGSVQVDDERLTIFYDLISPAPSPCQFSEEVSAYIYNITISNGQRDYLWADGEYRQTNDTHDLKIIMNFFNDPSSPFPPGSLLENWQTYCQ